MRDSKPIEPQKPSIMEAFLPPFFVIFIVCLSWSLGKSMYLIGLDKPHITALRWGLQACGGFFIVWVLTAINLREIAPLKDTRQLMGVSIAACVQFAIFVLIPTMFCYSFGRSRRRRVLPVGSAPPALPNTMYLFQGDQQTGPFHSQQILAMWTGGQITADAQICPVGGAEWVPLLPYMTQ
jgi:hypothetical protein